MQMSADPHVHVARSPWWFKLLGRMLEPWVRIKRDPAEPAALLRSGAAVCYAIERDGTSDALILERACREAGLPSPMQLLDLPGRRRRPGRSSSCIGLGRPASRQARSRISASDVPSRSMA